MPPFSSHRTLGFELSSETRRVKGFSSTRWFITDLSPGHRGSWVLDLQLFMTERAAYRFNLRGGVPRLFVLAGQAGDDPVPSAITASQDVAAAWLDGEHRVLETPMPMAIQVWVEAYLAHHGEAPAEGRKKNRKGAGRARELDA
jgi:hypothetical protein